MTVDWSSYRTCWTVEEWAEALREARTSRWRGLDFEARPDQTHAKGMPDRTPARSALRAEDGAEVCGIGVAWVYEGRLKSAYVGIRHEATNAGGMQPDADRCLRLLDEAIADTPDNGGWVVANLAMELSMLLREKVRWPKTGQIHDVQIAARILNKGVGFKELIGLKELQESILRRDMGSVNLLDTWLKSHRLKPGRDIWYAPVPVVSPYCQDDARDALVLWASKGTDWATELYQAPTGWWRYRAPNRMERKDLYELEVEAAIKALMAGLRGFRFDNALAKRRAAAAEMLQSVTGRWIRDRLNAPTLNPGSGTQLRGILFGTGFGFQVSTVHMTDSFKKLSDRDQAKVLAGVGEHPLVDYASLDVDALNHYAKCYPEHADLLFMLAVYRRCTTAITWFKSTIEEFGSVPGVDVWWDDSDSGVQLLHLLYHRLKTVGTVSGRMSSSEFNGQQVPVRTNMLIALEVMVRILTGYLPESQLAELVAALDVVAADKDAAKAAKVKPGDKVVTFSPRAMFIPRPGCVLRNWDLSQVEMREFANLTGNPMLCQGYGQPLSDESTTRMLEAIEHFKATGRLPPGTDLDYHTRLNANPFDIHQKVADECDISRGDAKGVNFGTIYGMGKRKLARERGWGKEQSEVYFARYHSMIPEIMMINTGIKRALQSRGYVFDTFGRRYYLPPDRAYVGLNRLVQGRSASLFKTGFVRTCEIFEAPVFGGQYNAITQRCIPMQGRVLTCVHDEQMAEMLKSMDTHEMDWAVRSAMVAFFGMKVPLDTSSEGSCESWDAEDEYKYDYVMLSPGESTY